MSTLVVDIQRTPTVTGTVDRTHFHFRQDWATRRIEKQSHPGLPTTRLTVQTQGEFASAVIISVVTWKYLLRLATEIHVSVVSTDIIARAVDPYSRAPNLRRALKFENVIPDVDAI